MFFGGGRNTSLRWKEQQSLQRGRWCSSTRIPFMCYDCMRGLKIWKKVVKDSPEEVFHHCNPLCAIVLHLAIQMTSNDCETTQFSCKHSASLLAQSNRKSAWETLRGSLKQSPAIGSPWFHLHASFGARSIKAMAAERFRITPQFTNCATRPWTKYPSGQLPESEDKYDSLNRFAEEKLYCLFSTTGKNFLEQVQVPTLLDEFETT